MTFCLEGDFPEVSSIAGGFHYYCYIKRCSDHFFLLYVDFTINQHFPSYQLPLILGGQDRISQHNTAGLKTLFTLEVTRFSLRLNFREPIVVSLKYTEHDVLYLKSDEN